jgi:hypothetical protein
VSPLQQTAYRHWNLEVQIKGESTIGLGHPVESESHSTTTHFLTPYNNYFSKLHINNKFEKNLPKKQIFGLNAIKITQNGRSKEYGNTTYAIFRISPVIGSIIF